MIRTINVRVKDIKSIIDQLNGNVNIWGLLTLDEWKKEITTAPVPESLGSTYSDNINYMIAQKVTTNPDTYSNPLYIRPLGLSEVYVKLSCELVDETLIEYDWKHIKNRVVTISFNTNMNFITFSIFHDFAKCHNFAVLSYSNSINDFIEFVNNKFKVKNKLNNPISNKYEIEKYISKSFMNFFKDTLPEEFISDLYYISDTIVILITNKHVICYDYTDSWDMGNPELDEVVTVHKLGTDYSKLFTTENLNADSLAGGFWVQWYYDKKIGKWVK